MDIQLEKDEILLPPNKKKCPKGYRRKKLGKNITLKQKICVKNNTTKKNLGTKKRTNKTKLGFTIPKSSPLFPPSAPASPNLPAERNTTRISNNKIALNLQNPKIDTEDFQNLNDIEMISTKDNTQDKSASDTRMVVNEPPLVSEPSEESENDDNEVVPDVFNEEQEIDLFGCGLKKLNSNMSAPIAKTMASLTNKDNKAIDCNCYGNSNNEANVYDGFNISAVEHEKCTHYQDIMCLKPTTYGPKVQESDFLNECPKLSNRDNLKYRCVKPKGHTGKCSKNLDVIFPIKNETIKKLCKSIDQSIYKTPGNDDYVYKNRADRLFSNVLSNEEGKKIRDKNIKKKCAIPLKDASTPLLLAQAYLDWITFITNIEGIDKFTDISPDISSMINQNKKFLISHYAGRKIFDKEGNTICVVTGKICKLEDFADPSRDNRVDIRNTDIQLGHNEPRSDKYVSIRGTNLLPMSRRGNLLIGENKFTDDKWIDEFKRLADYHGNSHTSALAEEAAKPVDGSDVIDDPLAEIVRLRKLLSKVTATKS